MVRRGWLVLLAVVAGLAWAEDPQALLEANFRPGQALTVGGVRLFVEKVVGGKLVLSPPTAPTATLGAFITPVEVTAKDCQDGAGRFPAKLIDSSGWGETFPGSGVYTHTNNIYEGGACMWNGAGSAPASWLVFDLGAEQNVAGVYVWNYNETGWQARSVKDLDILASSDGKDYQPVGTYVLEQATGRDDYTGQAVRFAKTVRARWFRFDIRSNYKGNDCSGMAKVRFANADVAWTPAAARVARYPRPTHPKLRVGEPLAGAENIVFPADAGIIDVTRAPYLAKGDGVADDTAAIQKALDDHPNAGAIIYLPNGVYRISNTLTWPTGRDDSGKRTTLQGQSRDGTVIVLKDACPGYADPRKPRAMVYTGYAPAQRFGNEVRNLTLDSGADNPGCCALRFIANNQGGVYDVAIVSGDGQGVAGLDMAYTNEEGPLLIARLKVVGFDYGVQTAGILASETIENLRLEHQNKAGLHNGGQPLSVRGLTSLNDVPAVHNASGLLMLIDCDLVGEGAAKDLPAVVNEHAIIARNVTTRGYAVALDNRFGEKQTVRGPAVVEFRAPAATLLGGTATGTLNLPIRETPNVPWDDPAGWAVVKGRNAAAIQTAIDSGATTVFLPRGEYDMDATVVLRGKVRRVLGGKPWLKVAGALRTTAAPMFRLEDGAEPVVSLERLDTDFSGGPFWFISHDARRTLVLRQIQCNYQGAACYRNTGTGDLFIEDVVGSAFTFTRQNVWARQFNSERNSDPGLHVLNDGGTVWALGFKTEGGGVQWETRGGGRSEILGGEIGVTNSGKLAPMFVNSESKMTAAAMEVCFNNDPFDKPVSETLGGTTKVLRNEAGLSGGRFVLYEGH
ncbi:MAG: discoidin domain-containing protein [Armatimonadetes bacterium]|nr:discoidin domain-containing protein [Armatimonadota bacterium]